VSTGALDVVATAAPGIKDILLLGKVKQLERAGAADLIVLDAPAAGHAITFLQSARSLIDTVSVGPINAQARDVLELLEDHERSQVMLVTIAEETPVNEAVETAFALEDRVGVKLGAIVVNEVDRLADDEGIPDPRAVALPEGPEAELLSRAADYRRSRLAMQDEEIARLARELALEQWQLPLLPVARLEAEHVKILAGALRGGP
jgi:anion-transporting  ArsA/GET3 family ATPase